MIQGRLFHDSTPPTARNRLWAARTLRDYSTARCARYLGVTAAHWRSLELGPLHALRPNRDAIKDLLGFGDPWWDSPAHRTGAVRSDARAKGQHRTVLAVAQAITHLHHILGEPIRPAPTPVGTSGQTRAEWILNSWHQSQSLYQAVADIGYRLWALGSSQSPPLWLYVETSTTPAIATTSHPNPTIHRLALINALTDLHTTDLNQTERDTYWRTLTTTTTQPPAPQRLNNATNIHHIHGSDTTEHTPVTWDRPRQHLPTTTELHKQSGIPTDLLTMLTLSYHNTPQPIHQPQTEPTPPKTKTPDTLSTDPNHH